MSYKLFELVDMNRGQIYQDFTNGEEIRKAQWGFQPYNPPDGEPGFVNEEFIKLVEKRESFIMRRPIFSMATLTEEYFKAQKNLNEYMKKANEPFKFFKNLLKLQEALKQHGHCEGELLSEDVPVMRPTEMGRAQGDKMANFVAQEVGLPQPQHFGEGGYGHAYMVGDKVLKITSDASEADAALKIKSYQPESMADIYNVWKVVDSDENLFYYATLGEFIEDKRPEYFHELLNTYNEIAFAAGQPDIIKIVKKQYKKNFDYNTLVKNLKFILSSNPELNIPEAKRIEVYKYILGLAAIMRDLHTIGAAKIDDFLTPSNLGYKNGKLVFFDVGGAFNVAPPEMPAELTLVTEGIFDEKKFSDDMVNKIAKRITQHIKVQKLDYMDTGLSGDAYDIGGDVVMKLTRDKSEARNNLNMKGKKFKHIADPYNVFEVATQDEQYPIVYVILLEKLRSDANIQVNMERLKYAFEKVIGLTNYEDLIDEMALGDMELYSQHQQQIEAYFNKNPKDKEFFDQMVGVSREVQKNYIDSRDYFGYTNLGYKKDGSIGFFDLGFGDGFVSIPQDVDRFEIDEDASAKFSTDSSVGRDDFPTYNNINTSPSIENDLNANSAMYTEDLEYNNVVGDATEDEYELTEERDKSYMPKSQEVKVKRKCQLAGLGNTSVACNQGDIKNLEFSPINEISVGGEYIAYHGSDKRIDKFTDEFIGAEEATDQEGPGIYFTTDREDAEQYGEFVHLVKLKPRKLVDETSHEDINPEEIINLIRMAPDWEMNAQNWDEDSETGLHVAVKSIMKYAKNEKDLFQQVWYDFFRYNPVEYVKGMVSLGYDGQLIKKEHGYHIIVYNPDIINYHREDYLDEVIVQEVNEFIKENKEMLKEKDIMTLEELPFRNEIERAGGKIYAVGGSVRDSYIGKSSKDLDIVIAGLPAPQMEKILAKYGKANHVGQSFGVYKFVPTGGVDEIDIALPRTEKSTGPGHKDFEIVADHRIPIEKDLERRDITINAIAKDVNGTTIDPYNGLQDISNGIIRVVGDDSFHDDALRMLRAVRFASRFGFKIEPETYKSLQQNADRISTIAPDRVYGELESIVSKSDIFEGARLLKDSGLLKGLTGVDGPLYAGPHWDNVKTVGEYIYLLTHNLVPSVSKFTRDKITNDNKVIDEIKALEYGLSDDAESTDPKENRWIAKKINDKSARALNSKLLPRMIQIASDEFSQDRFPKNENGLDLDGNDIKALGYEGEPVGVLKRWLLDNVYSGNVRNYREDLLGLLKTMTPETLEDLHDEFSQQGVEYMNKINEKGNLSESKYSDTKGSIERSKSIPKEMKEKIIQYLGGGSSYHDGGRVHGLQKPKVKGKQFKGVGLGADKKGFYVYTHRAASKRYNSPDKIPQKDIDFIESTG